MQIGYFPGKKTGEETFSIVIPTWNNLTFLKICVASILKNSAYKHQVIIHVNDGSDGTLEWVKQQGFDYTCSAENVGLCKGVNAAAGLARTDYILYLNDDMYVCPDWDLYLAKEIEAIGHPMFYLSSTLIEPAKSNNTCVLSPYDFGTDEDTFREQELLKALPAMASGDWSGSTWPPSIMHRKMWDLIGGYSIEFSPGMYSDPDISMKLWQAGVRYFKGIGKSKVYHFMSKSTGKVKKNHGKSTFYRKWKISNSTFVNFYLRMGQEFRPQTCLLYTSRCV